MTVKTKDIALETTILLAKLKDQGVDVVVISYAGSGDSGCVEHIGYFASENIEKNKGELDPSMIAPWDHECDITPENEKEVFKFIEDLAYSYLMKGFSDWYNNDGGQGVILIETATGKWHANNQTNITSVEEESHGGKLGDL